MAISQVEIKPDYPGYVLLPVCHILCWFATQYCHVQHTDAKLDVCYLRND